MIKKTVLVTLFVLFTGTLIAGGIYRTSTKSGYDVRFGESIVEISQNPNSSTLRSQQAAGSEDHQQGGERAGQGMGNDGAPQGRNVKTQDIAGEGQARSQGGQGRQGQDQETQSETGQGQRGQGQGQGKDRSESHGQLQEQEGGYGQGQGRQGERTLENTEIHESILIEGTISQAPAAGVDMIVETASGQVLVGTGPGYLQEMGFVLANGEAVQVTGFYEDDEFKAESITRLSSGEAIALRDEFGRPMWSGAARNARGGNRGNGQAGI